MSSTSFQEKVTGRGIHYVTPVARAEAKGLVAAVYDQMAREFAIVPPLTIHSPVPEILAGVWALAREAFIVGPQGRARREALAAAVSRANECPFCVDVHSTMLHGAGQHRLAASLLTKPGSESAELADPLVAWGIATASARTLANFAPPFGRQEAPQILGTAVLFHYLNRMVNVFLEPSPIPSRSATIKALIARLVGATIGKRLIGIDVQPGRSLHLLPASELPAEFSWSAPDAAVAGALARFAAAVHAHGEAALPVSVRNVTRGTLAAWQGEYPGLGHAWLDAAVAPLGSEAERAAARLMLLTAIASYRVNEDTIRQFRAHFPTDGQLIAATAWASFEAAKRISTWLPDISGRPHAA